LIVHSNGTRFESQWFRIDFTGNKKYQVSPQTSPRLRRRGKCCEAGYANQSRVSAFWGRRATFRTGPFHVLVSA